LRDGAELGVGGNGAQDEQDGGGRKTAEHCGNPPRWALGRTRLYAFGGTWGQM